jgi:transcriptional regulator with XRE-family HTH domain
VNKEQAMERIGRLIKEERIKLGMTQEPFAEHTGLDAKTISSMERGTRIAWEQSQRKVETALGWRPGSIQEVIDQAEKIPYTSLTLESMKEAGGHASWHDLAEESRKGWYGPDMRASQLTDAEIFAAIAELTAELSSRLRNYKNRLNGETKQNHPTPE